MNAPEPASSMPTCTRHGGASARRCHARTVSVIPVTTNSHAATWKNPSASVFASRPATVFAVSLPRSPVSMWCHRRI